MSPNKPEKMSLQWPAPGAFRKSIRTEFSIYIVAFILIIMGVTGYVITYRYSGTVTQNVIDNLLVQARSYTGPAGKLILSSAEPDALLLSNLCSKLVQNNPDIYWVGITDEEQNFVAHTDIKQVFAEKTLRIKNESSGDYILKENETMSMTGDTIYLTVPIVENNIDVGTIALASSSRQIKEAKSIAIYTVSTITIIMMLIGIPISMLVLNRKLRPISEMADSLKSVDFDDFEIKLNIRTRNELGYLAETLRVMGGRIRQAGREALERDRMSRELEIAKEIQRNILPTYYPKKAELEFAGIYSSAREIGGDYYDFIDFGDGYTGFLIADVSGKSLPGMLVMMLTRDIVKKNARLIRNPAQLLTVVNEELLQNIKKGMFVTMFIAVVDENKSKAAFASAGHNPLIVINSQKNKIELLKTKGFPLGMVSDDQFRERIEFGECQLNPGDWLIQFTDGINEAQDNNKNEYGMDRFIDSLRDSIDSEPRVLVTNVMESLKRFTKDAPQFDDITLLAMKWHGIKLELTGSKKVYDNATR